MSVVRKAEASDLDACAEIGGWSKAQLHGALSDPGRVFLVAEWAGAPVGFLIASEAGVVDDFHVEAPGLWPSVGQHLLREARARLKARGVVHIVVRGGDAAKNALLESEGLSLTEAGWTAPA